MSDYTFIPRDLLSEVASLGGPTDSDKIESMNLMASALSCAVPGSQATYVAGPITGGSRLLDWYQSGRAAPDTESSRFRQEVVEPNIADGLRAVSALRASGRLVVEPFSLVVPSWTQADYRLFWCGIVAEFAESVACLDGWSLSAGAILECYVALRLGRVVTCDGNVVSVATAVREVGAGISRCEALRIDAKFASRVWSALQRLR